MATVKGKNKDYVLMSRTAPNSSWILHDVIALPPKNGSLNDKAREGKSAGYRVLILFRKGADQNLVLKDGEPWMVQINHIKPFGAITEKTVPRGVKEFEHFRIYGDAHSYVEKLSKETEVILW